MIEDEAMQHMSDEQRQAVHDIRTLIALHFPAALLSIEVPGTNIAHLSVYGEPDHIEALMRTIVVAHTTIAAAERVRQRQGS